MDAFLPMLTALWLGILTSISPCPLATNIAAISFVSYRIAHKGMVFLTGLAYTLGRSIVYVVISFMVVKVLVSVPSLSFSLQRHMNQVLGVLLILVGLILLDVLRINLPRISPSESVQKKFDNAGILGAFALGAVFALAFCPVSAALFFGSLIPLAITARSSVFLPTLYGVGTAVPVLLFALAVFAGTEYLARLYQRITTIEFYAKKITGLIFVVVGIRHVLKYVVHVL